MDFAPYIAQLGLPGIAFILFMGLAQLGLTQFVKVILKERFDTFGGTAIMLLSVGIGGLLGWVMLARVAKLLEINLREPWAGIFAGMLLGAIVAGLVSYWQQRSREKNGHQIDGMTAILAQIAAAQPQAAPVQVQTPGPVTVTPTPTPVPRVDMTLEQLRPITPEEAANMTRGDWPEPPELVTDRH